MNLLKHIPFLESSNYSPWPMRLIGLTPWQKTERTTKEILDEYNNIWYKNALQAWENYADTHEYPTPSRFFRLFDNIVYNQMVQNFEIYGIDKDEHLISINRELYTAKWSVISALYDNLLVDNLEYYTNAFQAPTLVELGCGTGKNLFNAYTRLSLNNIIGGEICSNAVKLGNSIVERCNIEGSFKAFDYFQSDCINSVVSGINGNYILFTSHSIEQIQLNQTNFIEQILTLEHPPEVIIHFEPIFDENEPTFFQKLHHLYTEKNLYNKDLLNELRKYGNKGKIKIVSLETDVFGLSAFNPTSVVVWKIQK
ncbi:TPA: hypothetical protein ACGAPA_002280 [Legionella pneumophila]